MRHNNEYVTIRVKGYCFHSFWKSYNYHELWDQLSVIMIQIYHYEVRRARKKVFSLPPWSRKLWKKGGGVKGPYKWTFFKTSLLHVFYQFWHADYEYDIFKIKKNGNYDFWIVKKGPSAPAMRPAHRHKKKWRPVRWKQCSQRTSEAFYSFPHKKMKFWGEDLSIYKICWFWQIFALVHR